VTTLEIIAYGFAVVGGVLVCVSFFMKTIIPLRVMGAASNIMFIIYGVLLQAWPVLLVNLALLPINCFRTVSMVRLTRRVEAAAASGDPSGIWLRPYMRTRKFRAGDVLFRKGDPATDLYYLAQGRVRFDEIDVELAPGRIFGEIAFFTQQRVRTQSARCVEDSTVLTIDESTLKQLYYQNPEFGFHLVNLVARRLVANVDRLETQLAAKPYGLDS
jgi:hypothetical protein